MLGLELKLPNMQVAEKGQKTMDHFICDSAGVPLLRPIFLCPAEKWKRLVLAGPVLVHFRAEQGRAFQGSDGIKLDPDVPASSHILED